MVDTLSVEIAFFSGSGDIIHANRDADDDAAGGVNDGKAGSSAKLCTYSLSTIHAPV